MNRPNNVFGDREGNVYRQDNRGNWDRNTAQGWQPQPQPSPGTPPGSLHRHRGPVRRLPTHLTLTDDAKTSGTCRDILEREPALFTFVRQEGVEPTINVVERSLRGRHALDRVTAACDSALHDQHPA